MTINTDVDNYTNYIIISTLSAAVHFKKITEGDPISFYRHIRPTAVKYITG